MAAGHSIVSIAVEFHDFNVLFKTCDICTLSKKAVFNGT